MTGTLERIGVALNGAFLGVAGAPFIFGRESMPQGYADYTMVILLLWAAVLFAPPAIKCLRDRRAKAKVDV